VIVDANVLIYAVDESSPQHESAERWLTNLLNGDERVGLPWSTIGAFLRIVTHPRILTEPLSAPVAWSLVEEWLELDLVWIPSTSHRTARILGRLMAGTRATGNLIPDAMLAALAIEHGLVVATTDTDFGRFREVRWINPVA
jgi:toxin-antitoxin system PIN domain toxin